MSSQEQFLNVIDRDLAEQRFHEAIDLQPLGEESVPLVKALGRVLACDVIATCDVPSFDRSNYDGFAVRAEDTFYAQEEIPKSLELLEETIPTAQVPRCEVMEKTAVEIATGGMIPRGADAVVMVEHTEVIEERLLVRKAVTSGFGIAFAGTDIAAGETVLRTGTTITSRESGVLAALGMAEVVVWRKPRVAILSTGDEIIPPGEPMRPPLVYDSNAQILADAVREQGGEPVLLGIVHDRIDQLRAKLDHSLKTCDIVLLSGGTSKGKGDLSYKAVQELTRPGIVAHGVALKPGKPICLAACDRRPVVILPGFPTSAIFTFHEFVAPVIRSLAGHSAPQHAKVWAKMAVKVNSEIGRTEYLLVGLVQGRNDPSDGVSLAAYPMGKGSGSVTTFSQADGFVTIDRHEEIVPAEQVVEVQLLGRDLRLADLVVIGSHCLGLDLLMSKLQGLGVHCKFLAVGSTAGLMAAQRGECDIAGIHLLDSDSGTYNRPFLSADLELIEGYSRMQGVVFRRGEMNLENQSAQEAITHLAKDPQVRMINRNRGSGTGILLDQYLAGAQPAGYAVQARSHNAVTAAVAQGRADWGVAIESAARNSQLGFLPLVKEHYDFVVPKSRAQRPAVRALRKLLNDPVVRAELKAQGLEP